MHISLKHRSLAAITGLTAAAGIVALSMFAGVSQGARLSQYERTQVILEATTVQAAVESGFSKRISLERGLVAFIASDPTLDENKYRAYADALVTNDPVIKNFAVLEGTTIKYVYPFEPNKSAIGKDLALVQEQAESVLKAKTTRDPIIFGPFQLVQGGTGITSRMGIFTVEPEGPRYWGQASVVVDSAMIFHEAGAADHPNLRFALRLRDKNSHESSVFFGEAAILGERPITLDITLPGVSWALEAVPRGGWKKFHWVSVIISVIGSAIAAFSGFAIFGLVSTRAALKEMAYHDQLTELPNRSLFWDRLRVEVSRAERGGTSVCICMVDLNGFKSVNDDHGHEAGDRLLTEVALRMSSSIRKSDTVARFGGDEFAIIAPVDCPVGVEEVESRIRSCFVAPFNLGGVIYSSGASIGSALYPRDGTNVENVLATADKRMYDDKRSVHNAG